MGGVLVDEAVTRGVAAPVAGLVAAAGGGEFRVVYAGWLADRARTTLATRLDRALDALADALR